MSQLGRAVRNAILAAPNSGQVVPGGVYPEIAPATVKMPFLVYTGASSERISDITGECMYMLETVEFVATADTRAECESILSFVADAVKVGSWSGTSSPRVYWWRLDNHGDVSEVLVEGSDDMIRQVRMTMVGAIQAGV